MPLNYSTTHASSYTPQSRVIIAPPAAMQSALHTPVPSSSLLRFLKTQSEGVCFFSPNTRPAFVFDHAAPRGPHLKARLAHKTLKSITRCISTTVPRQATVEAGFLNLDFLWPRSAALALRPQGRSISRTKLPIQDHPSGALRSSSTRTGKWQEWHRKLWGQTSKKGGRPLRPDDLPILEESSDSAFRMGHRISAKAAAQPKLRCTELDENGNVVLASGEFKKSELIAKVRP